MRIGLLLYPDCMPAGLFGFSDLLLAASLRSGQKTFEFDWVSEQGGTIRTANGISLETKPLSQQPLDALVIPGAWRDTDTVIHPHDAIVVAAIRRLPATTRLWSYCTGVCLAAQTRGLDGLPATTTWWLRDRAARAFPDIHWKPNQTLVYTDTHATASGVHGYLPLALAVLEEYLGTTIVEEVRRYMVLPRPATCHTPFQELPLLIQRGGWLRKVIQWIEHTPANRQNIAALANAMRTSPRTLQRRVLRESGYRCGKLMRLVKLNQVGDRLISSEQPLSLIANNLGFADDASLRRSFRQVSGMTPREYRQHFGQTGW